jgi:hypothetical protein
MLEYTVRQLVLDWIMGKLRQYSLEILTPDVNQV